MFKDYVNDPETSFSSVLELDLSTVEPSVSGPKRPHDYVQISNMKKDWNESLTNPVGFKGFGLTEESSKDISEFEFNG